MEDLKLFRSIQSKLTGHGESHLNPEGVLLSNGPLEFRGGPGPGSRHGGQDRRPRPRHPPRRVRRRLHGRRSEGSLRRHPRSGRQGPRQSVRHGRLRQRHQVVRTHHQGLLLDAADASKPWTTSAGTSIRVPNGHDLQAVYLAIEKAVADAKANPTRPVCLWVKTIKGYGIKATEENSAGGHGFPLANGEKIPAWITELYAGATPPQVLVDWAASLAR
ncbi:MAG: hypothetical protein V9G14_04250 [Cypionkella sp.]